MSGNRLGPTPSVVVDELIEYVADLLGKRFKKCQIKAQLEDEFGMGVSPRSLEDILARARLLMVERSNQPRSHHLANAVEFYESIIASPDASPKDKIAAQTRLDDLLGISSQFGTQKTPDEQAAAAREAMRQMDESDSDVA